MRKFWILIFAIICCAALLGAFLYYKTSKDTNTSQKKVSSIQEQADLQSAEILLSQNKIKEAQMGFTRPWTSRQETAQHHNPPYWTCQSVGSQQPL